MNFPLLSIVARRTDGRLGSYGAGMVARSGRWRELGVSLRDTIRNMEIRKRTRVNDIAQQVAKLKWQWAGHIVQRRDGCLGSTNTGKRSVGRSQTGGQTP
ncbi:jg12063 [Pararge aegeria aegeria]|uniref:Jg12063 protein n=1 Tax=Pararge aegeria aegeria TaxID=348720 RepID=A0A8S4RL45_9NEOP|nr:jg12063 [Pararge aegeria aegeria]